MLVSNPKGSGMVNLSGGSKILESLGKIANEYKLITENEPRVIAHDQLPKVESYIVQLHDALQINDHPYIVEAMIKTICISENPAIRTVLSELYMLAKLTSDGTEPYLSSAEFTIKKIRDRNSRIDADNQSRREEFEAKINEQTKLHDAAIADLLGWWDSMVARLTTIHEQSNGTLRDIIDQACFAATRELPSVFVTFPLHMKSSEFNIESICSMPSNATYAMSHFVKLLHREWDMWYCSEVSKLDLQIRKEFSYSEYDAEWYGSDYFDDYDDPYQSDSFKQYSYSRNDFSYTNRLVDDFRIGYEARIKKIVDDEIDIRRKMNVEGWVYIF